MAMATHPSLAARHLLPRSTSQQFPPVRALAFSSQSTPVSAPKFRFNDRNERKSWISAHPTAFRLAWRERDVSATILASTRNGQDGRGGKDVDEEKEGAEVPDFDISRLEAYTERVRSEVLSVSALVDDEEDLVIVYKGFSSSLMRPTPDDLSEPVLPANTVVLGIDRMEGPYNPAEARYIQRDMSWLEFQQFLQGGGL